MPSGLCQDDRAIPIFVEALFEDAAAKVINLSLPHLHDRLAQFVVPDARLPRGLGEPTRFEDAAH
jgi:hypothetical protein